MSDDDLPDRDAQCTCPSHDPYQSMTGIRCRNTGELIGPRTHRHTFEIVTQGAGMTLLAGRFVPIEMPPASFVEGLARRTGIFDPSTVVDPGEP